MLTPIRARLLRYLDRETPMSAVPALLTCSPPTATHHCAALAKAGLIHRRRQGRTVSIARTRRGDLLLEAYATAAP
nr:helix-turn-helix domain-containing protein [Streptomonospora alba]